jgi:hypothetical protein
MTSKTLPKAPKCLPVLLAVVLAVAACATPFVGGGELTPTATPVAATVTPPEAPSPETPSPPEPTNTLVVVATPEKAKPTATSTTAPTDTATVAPTLTPTGTLLEPFYGTHFVLSSDLGTVRELGVEVVLTAFPHNGTPENWLAYLNAAQVQDIQVIAWLWPQGWTWDGTAWRIDNQAELFVQTVAGHPALLAVYALHEPYWNGCLGCGYTTAEQQALYRAIKAIADVPIHSAVDSMSAWTAYGEETAFAEGICDYCETWYHPLREDGTYERERFISQLTADLAVARERAPNSRIVWSIQCFAQNGYYRMPTADEMRDLASIVYSTDIDGALWYPWTMSGLYSDFLSNHPELYPVVREVYDEYVLKAKHP